LSADADAAGVMELKVVSDFIPAGDHEVVICDVVNWKTPEAADKQTPLYTGYLRREGYL
jgi:flavin reductase (DIM6/NTAB) family NADH-FMN oxidoreductase RutF